MLSHRDCSCFLYFSTVVVVSIYIFVHQTHHPLSPPPPSMMSHDSDILSDLRVSLQQTSKSPPAICIKVTNNSSRPVTVLTWESPLDQLALQLGLLTITPESANASASAPLDIPTIKVSRKLPPGNESLVSLAPGESRENHVVFQELLVPLAEIRGKKARVSLKGRWTRVWPKARSELTQEQIEGLGAEGGAVSGECKAEGIEIEVE